MNDREQFERWASDEGLSPRAIEKDAQGNYKLMQVASDWRVWQAARATPAQPVPEASCSSTTEIFQFALNRLPTEVRADALEDFKHPLRIVINDAINEAYASGRLEGPAIGTPEGLRVYAKGYAAGKKKGNKEIAPSPASVSAAIRALKLPKRVDYREGKTPEYTADQVRALIAEVAALAEQVQGQPWISVQERMPESGKRVVFAWTNKLGKARTSMGQWNERWEQVANSSDEDACEYDQEQDEYFLLEGWQEWGWELEFSAYVEGEVTHWMPLPAAPSIAQDGQKSEGA